MFVTIKNKDGVICYGREDDYAICSWGENHLAICKQLEYCNPELPMFTIASDRGMISASSDILLNVNNQILIGNKIYKFIPNKSLTFVRRVLEWNEDVTLVKKNERIAIGNQIVVDSYITIGCLRLETVHINGYRCRVHSKKDSNVLGDRDYFLSWTTKKRARLPKS